LRSVGGGEYLHLIEWQGYADPLFLWRTLGYLAWLGQNRTERPIRVTLIYLTPTDDVGTRLDQASSEIGGWQIAFSCVRLWQHDATAAVASGQPGLLTLAPLMRGATPKMVEQIVQTLLAQVSPPVQGELLAALGIFAEPIFDTERFIRLVTKERLMATDLISLLTADLVEEKATLVEEKAILVEEKAILVKQLRAARENQAHLLQQMIEDVIVIRFPSVPALITRKLRDISDLNRLEALHRAALQATDLAALEQQIDAAPTS
jgi:hypothetical protein